jgi:hypothetical protein
MDPFTATGLFFCVCGIVLLGYYIVKYINKSTDISRGIEITKNTSSFGYV